MASNDRKSKCELRSWLRGPFFLLYINYLSATWTGVYQGFRMWNFALGMFFVVLADKALLLSAIYGFMMGGSVLIFGGLVGDWVDRTNRLIAIRKSIVAQKLSVFLCASLICVIFSYHKAISSVWGGAISVILQGVVVVLAVVAELATIAYQRIQLQKDWFIVTTQGNTKKLANLNAGTRSVDLITNILSPIITGQIMTSVSQVIAGVTIAVWHIVAIVVEICLVTRIYNMLPEMAIKNNCTGKPVNKSPDELQHLNKEDNALTEDLQIGAAVNEAVATKGNFLSKDNEAELYDRTKLHKNRRQFCHQMFSKLQVMKTGWKIYARQVILFAGISLAFLYMTVLGFDSVTIGYIYSNNVPENIVGIIMAVASLAGVLGAFLFTQIRKCLGLERTGIISMSWQVGCLAFCVVSIILPCSPFQPEALWNGVDRNNLSKNTSLNCNNFTTSNVESDVSGSMDHYLQNFSNVHTTIMNSVGNVNIFKNASMICDDYIEPPIISQSIVVFLTAICLSRIGLYLTDLVIAQLIQENVPETERGIVNGVQWSLNNLMGMLKFTLVIILPQIQTFGYLIVISFVFIVLAFILYLFYCYKVSKFSCTNCITGKTVTSRLSKDTTESIENV